MKNVIEFIQSLVDVLYGRRNLRQIYKERGARSADEFIVHFNGSDVPKSLILTVYTYIQGFIGFANFPVLPADPLNLYGIGGHGDCSLFEIFDDLSLNYAFPKSSFRMFREIDQPIETVEDLIFYLDRQLEL